MRVGSQTRGTRLDERLGSVAGACAVPPGLRRLRPVPASQSLTAAALPAAAARGATRRRPPADPARTRDAKLQRLEAVLLLAREPLNSRKLSQFANLADGTEARTLIRKLNEMYDRSGRAFRVEEVAGGYQLLTRPAFATWLRKLGHVPAEIRLSAPALETLAVIAYRQPVLRADIEAIRGVNCGEILRQLMERDLVRISGRSEELGRPFLYGTTRRFLQVFGLVDLDELPRADRLRGPRKPPAPSLAVTPDSLYHPEKHKAENAPEPIAE